VLGTVTAAGVLMVLLGWLGKFVLLLGLTVTVVFGIWLAITVANSPYRRERHRRQAAVRRAVRHLERVEGQWEHATEAYGRRHQVLSQLVADFVGRGRRLQQAYQEERRQLELRVEELARYHHLRGCFISDSTIPNIGEGRKQMLAAYNVLTAYDVQP